MIEVGKLVKRLWGDQFYDPKERKWSKTETAGSVRGFCQFILDPIFKVRMKMREILNFLSISSGACSVKYVQIDHIIYNSPHAV